MDPNGKAKSVGEPCDTSSQCMTGLQCLAGTCTEDTCRTNNDCLGVPSASCALWACVAARCVPGCFDGGLVSDAAVSVDSGMAQDSGTQTPDTGAECGAVRTATTGDLLVNEFLADPPADIPGDANLDNQTSSSDDEFIEIGNVSGDKIQLSGVSISDARGVKHVFGEYVLDCNQVVVVFGGGINARWPDNWFLASSGGLSLNNSGDTITIRSSTTALGSVESHTYGTEGGRDESMTRSPDLLRDARFVAHSSLPPGKLFSPGTRSDGNPF